MLRSIPIISVKLLTSITDLLIYFA